MEHLEKASKEIHEAIFTNKKEFEIDGNTLKVKKLSSGLRYVDHAGYRFLEQNRRKKSKWAEKAREGHEITWILKGRKYIGQVFDGEFRKF
ncbi:MAG: hypothetical protein EU539_06145 [Promethearchaeota archaeon]|nr:MAG: hypothetical protein EU539_06145 [Candidatus Lokiarchaeota archaeon]